MILKKIVLQKRILLVRYIRTEKTRHECLSNVESKYTELRTYERGSFFGEQSTKQLALIGLSYHEVHEQNSSAIEQIWEAEGAMAEQAEMRFVSGVWETIQGVALIVTGAVCIWVTCGAASPLVVGLGVTAGSGTIMFGASDMDEGMQNIYYGSTGNLDTVSINELKESVFFGNERAYQIAESVFAYTASGMIPIGALSTAGKLTWQTGAETIGKLVASDLFGRGVYEVSGIVTDNETVRMLAAMGASYASSSIMEYYDPNSILNMRSTEPEPVSQVVSETSYGKSSEKLDWDAVVSKKTGETRVEHVKLHESNDLTKQSHGVFYGDSQNTLNKAWQNKSQGIVISEGNTDMYIIPYENAGYAGGYGGQCNNLNSITIITQKDTNNIITGFPGNGYKYGINGLIGGK